MLNVTFRASWGVSASCWGAFSCASPCQLRVTEGGSLEVGAPFSGRVSELSSDVHRDDGGSKVVEVRDEDQGRGS